MQKNGMARLQHLAKNMSEPLLSLSFNVAGIAAGVFIAAYFNILSVKAWGFLVYPGIMSIRGAIGGLFAGRLSTALHLGTIEPRLTKNTEYANLLISSVTALTFISSLVMGLMGSIVSILMLCGLKRSCLRIFNWLC